MEVPEHRRGGSGRADGGPAAAPRVSAPIEPDPAALQRPPKPLAGGPLAFWRFARAHHMLHWRYLPLVVRWLYVKARWRGRLVTDGLCFIRPGVHFEIGRDAKVVLGRWSWLGDGCKIRAHEGVIEIGAKSVLGQECTLSCYQQISIGRDCIIADRVMMIDFDHGTAEVERPIREQGIYKRNVRVGHNVWIGYGASVLRGVTVGDHTVIGTLSVVTSDVPDDAVVGGAPARVLRMREHPTHLRYE
jgi:acetyltransferase-like isoleucine patch superfamily enzyme